MTIIRIPLVSLALLLTTFCANARDERQIAGSWIVINNEDRFGKGGTFVAATPDETAGSALTIRCIEKELSIAVLDNTSDPKPLKVGTAYIVKLRTDKEPIMTTIGKVINDRLIQVDTQADMVRTIRKGRETAVRLENDNGVSRTIVFRTKGTAKALSRIADECNLD